MNEEEKEKEKANIFASIIVRCIFIHTVGRPVFGAKARPSNQRYHWSLYLKKPMESVTSSVEFLSQLRLASTEPGNLTCQHFFHPSAIFEYCTRLFLRSSFVFPLFRLSNRREGDRRLERFCIEPAIFSCENFTSRFEQKKKKSGFIYIYLAMRSSCALFHSM